MSNPATAIGQLRQQRISISPPARVHLQVTQHTNFSREGSSLALAPAFHLETLKPLKP
jgi:hypothetical protein